MAVKFIKFYSEQKWISQKFNNGDFDYWLVRQLTDWTEHQSEEECKGYPRYTCELKVVAPEEFNDKRGVLDYWGLDQTWEELSEKLRVEVVEDYIGGATVWTKNGDNKNQLLKECRKEADMVNSLFGFYMDKYQNAYGATGWDWIKGNITPALSTDL